MKKIRPTDLKIWNLLRIKTKIPATLFSAPPLRSPRFCGKSPQYFSPLSLKKHKSEYMNRKPKHWASITAGILSLAGHASATSLGSEKYNYDASGNIIEKSIDGKFIKMNYDSSNRLTERQAAGEIKETFAYDAAGRPIAMKEGTEQLSRSTTYGYGDKVMETASQGINTGFCYNAEGQLVAKLVAGRTILYAWDDNVLAAEGAEVFTNEDHVTGGVPVMAANRDAIVSDYLGNTLSLANQSFTSTAFGEGLEEGRFTGKVFVKELGGYSFLHRLFAPELSRWTTSDPSGFPEGTNNSLYVKSDPCGYVDPLGLLGTANKLAGPWVQTWTSASGDAVSWWADKFEITCDDGNTKVVGYKPMTGVSVAGYDVSHNCHGFAFAESEYWINEPSGIITGDSWKSATDGKLDSNKSVRAVYFGHSARVTTITDKYAKKVIGKNGALVGTHTTDPDKQLQDPANQGTFGVPSAYYEK